MNRPVIASIVMSLVATSGLSMAAETQKSLIKPIRVAALNTTASNTAGSAVVAKNKKKKPKPSPTPAARVSNKSHAKAAKKTAAVVKPKAVARKSLSSVAAASSVVSSGQTATTITEVKKPAQKNPWGFKYRTENTISTAEANRQTGSVEALDRVYLNYSLDESSTISLVQYLNHTWFGDRDPIANGKLGSAATARSAFNLGDTYLEAYNSNIATFGNSGIVYSDALRVIAPISENSRLTEKVGQVNNYLWLTKAIGNSAIDFFNGLYLPAYQYRTHVENPDDPAKAHEVANQKFKMVNGIEISHDFSSVIGVELDNYLWNSYNHPVGDNPATEASSVEVIPQIIVTVNPHVKLTGGLDNEVQMRTQEEAFQLFRDKETAYYFKADFKF